MFKLVEQNTVIKFIRLSPKKNVSFMIGEFVMFLYFFNKLLKYESK
ncbi:hypothetical protein HMPREF9246_1417 [Anaerococcus hydrogenalis ACS-025-V-Sch4]|uniref:Uncharacterized protein n=1 Tax=Anaerococcus hydrogenalis ACS-025-V-Sch4 TaxID=879306 RepID=F0H1E2_9FIRM|nr:hypothetical protein HMPREF9246_1417 [Anaerococcus hydrogenalis ACS-025-V-Sch4]